MQFGIAESLIHWARYRPETPAVCDQTGITTYRQLNDLTVVLADKLTECCERQSRVAVAVRRKLHLLAAILAVIRAGKSVVVLNPNLQEDSLRANIGDTAVTALISDANYGHLTRLFPPETVVLNLVDVIAEAGLNRPREFYASVWRDAGDECCVLFSSGTTGTPKGIERNHESIVAELVGWCLELCLGRTTVFYIGRPIYYTGGLVLALSTLIAGGTVVMDDLADEYDFDEAWKCYQAAAPLRSLDLAFFIPDQVRHFCQLAQQQPPTAGARTILLMGAPITGAEKLTAAKALQSQIIESWGNTESLGTITEPEDLMKRPDSIGRPFLGDRLLIVDGECREQPAHVIGRIAGGEEAGFQCYSNRPIETQRVKRSMLIVSEDLGYQDEDGYFYICGREQECVLVGGKSVFLTEIERKLVATGSVREACVVALNFPDGSMGFGAMVVLHAISGLERATTVLKDLLPVSNAMPKMLPVAHLPRVPSGKIDRAGVIRTLADQ